MSELILIRPHWLWALLVIVAAGLFIYRRKRQGAWSQLVDPALLPALYRLGRIKEGGANLLALLPVLAAATLALALTGPAVPQPDQITYRAMDPIILILDLSPSIVAEDKPLHELQSSAVALLRQSEGRPVGMMVYAADAYLASAPTTDVDSLISLIGVLGAKTMPVMGSRPDLALSLSRDLFSPPKDDDQTGPGLGGTDLVIFTDGAGITPLVLEEAARLGHDGARLWAVALPAASAAPAPDPAALARLAQSGGGESYAYSDVSLLGEAITKARRAELTRDLRASRSLKDLGPWLLPLAMLCLLPLFRRRR